MLVTQAIGEREVAVLSPNEACQVRSACERASEVAREAEGGEL
jgi:hypothetical protein